MEACFERKGRRNRKLQIGPLWVRKCNPQTVLIPVGMPALPSHGEMHFLQEPQLAPLTRLSKCQYWIRTGTLKGGLQVPIDKCLYRDEPQPFLTGAIHLAPVLGACKRRKSKVSWNYETYQLVPKYTRAISSLRYNENTILFLPSQTRNSKPNLTMLTGTRSWLSGESDR